MAVHRVAHNDILQTETHRRDQNEKRLEHLNILRKQIKAQVDEDEILAQLREDGKHVLGRPLRALRHCVVGIVLECDAAEQEGHDAY